jgi:hypothetical protein
MWAGVEVTFEITKERDNWVIIRETIGEQDEDGDVDYDSLVRTICWESPCSANLFLPPKDNWRPVDPLARGNPTIEYVYRGNT